MRPNNEFLLNDGSLVLLSLPPPQSGLLMTVASKIIIKITEVAPFEGSPVELCHRQGSTY